MTDQPRDGQRARLVIEEAVWDGSSSWRVQHAEYGTNYYLAPTIPGLSWEPLPDPLPVEDRDALYLDRFGCYWRWHAIGFWCPLNDQALGLVWPEIVEQRGPLRKFTESQR